MWVPGSGAGPKFIFFKFDTDLKLGSTKAYLGVTPSVSLGTIKPRLLKKKYILI